mgnify:FL=1|jgi:hypothetical protein
MKITEAIEHYGKRVSVRCADGEEITGKLDYYQTHADDADDAERIGIEEMPGFLTDIPIDEVESITPLA